MAKVFKCTRRIGICMYVVLFLSLCEECELFMVAVLFFFVLFFGGIAFCV